MTLYINNELRRKGKAVLLALFLLPSTFVSAATHYVSPFGSHIAPFSTWANAATNIQSAINVASGGDTVIVTNGHYAVGSSSLNGNNRIIITNNITVQSVNGYSNTVIAGAADSGTGECGAEAIRCLYMSAGRLDGFTLRKGFTQSAGTYSETSGGGALLEGGAINNCRIAGSHAADYGASASISNAACTNSFFLLGTAGDPGSGVQILDGTRLKNCRINNYGLFPDMTLLGTNLIAITDGSAEPAITNGTAFGDIDMTSGLKEHTFTITNSGQATLSLYSITTNGYNPSDFIVTAIPSPTVSTNSSTTVTVRFDPTALGTRIATISIAGNDPDDDPFIFTVEGNGVEPEIAVLGTNYTVITNGSTAVSITNGTDFGDIDMSSGLKDHTFTITNSGTSLLNINSITTNGAHAADFIITAAPSSTVDTGTNTTFTIQFNPSDLGARTTTVSIANDDADEDPYVFTLTGAGVEPEMAVLGTNKTEIADGDMTPAITNGTDWGTLAYAAPTHTFTITNSGSSTLNLTNSPCVSITGVYSSYFSVATQPASSVTRSNSTTFAINFTPVMAGSVTALVTIANDDYDEDPYDFLIQAATTNALFATAQVIPGLRDPMLKWGDYDNDGDLDFAVAGYSVSGRFTAIYNNVGDGTFTNSGIALTAVENAAMDWGDYDNDGLLDIAIGGYSNTGRVSTIYHNDGSTLTNAGISIVGIKEGFMQWVDYDNDGDLDLSVAGSTGATSYTNTIYRNSAGVFTNISSPFTGIDKGNMAWGDYDNDMDLDMIMTGSSATGRVTKLYANNGNGSFSNMPISIPAMDNSELAWGDYDNDGDLDLAIAGYTTNGPTTRIYQNTDGVFSNISAVLQGIYYAGISWADYDNDGDRDLIVAGMTTNNIKTTSIYNNTGGMFTNSGTQLPGFQQASISWGDYDNDGDLDLVIGGIAASSYTTALYKNTAAVSNMPPDAPAELTAVLTNGQDVVLSWAPATDTETPSNGLSYNLYIGSTEALEDIMSSHANTNTGWRRVVNIGNAGQCASWRINEVPAGTNYWAVQAIDTAFAGSPFAVSNFVRAAIPDFVITDIQIGWTNMYYGEGATADGVTAPTSGRTGRDGGAVTPTLEGITTYTASITVSNRGEIAGDPGTLSVWANKSDIATNGATGDQDIVIGSLAAGAITNVTISGLPVSTTPSAQIFRAFVDSQNITTELYETNNQATVAYNVSDALDFEFASQSRTNNILLRWSDPFLSGLSNNTVMVRWSPVDYPADVTDGGLLYSGTNLFFEHTGLALNQTNYYRIWVSNNGTDFFEPSKGTNMITAYTHLLPVQILIRNSETLNGAGVWSQARILFYNDDNSGTIKTNDMADPFWTLTQQSFEKVGHFYGPTNVAPGQASASAKQILMRERDKLYTVSFDGNGNLLPDYSNTYSLISDFLNPTSHITTNAAQWDINTVVDINGDGQDEIILTSTNAIGATGAWRQLQLLFFDEDGTLRTTNQPAPEYYWRRQIIEGVGRFLGATNTVPGQTNLNAQQLLVSELDQTLYVINFDNDGHVLWNDPVHSNMYSTIADFVSTTNHATTNPADWRVSTIFDVNNDGQDEIILSTTNAFGKTAGWKQVQFLFFNEDGTLRATNQPAPQYYWTKQVLEGAGDFNPMINGEELLLREGNTTDLWTIYFDTDGNVIWDGDPYTNSVSSGTLYSTNAATWSIQGIGDFTGGR